MQVDFTATKNDNLIAAKKVDISATNNIMEVKQKAEGYLTVIRQNHKKESADAIINMLLLAGVFGIEILLWCNKASEKTSIIANK